MLATAGQTAQLGFNNSRDVNNIKDAGNGGSSRNVNKIWEPATAGTTGT
jgi:hypothetical protein